MTLDDSVNNAEVPEHSAFSLEREAKQAHAQAHYVHQGQKFFAATLVALAGANFYAGAAGEPPVNWYTAGAVALNTAEMAVEGRLRGHKQKGNDIFMYANISVAASVMFYYLGAVARQISQ